MPEPLYRAIARQLRTAIEQGAWPQGATIPTEHELCARHGISRHTAREALRLLTEDGLIERRRGAGTTVASRRPSGPFVLSVSSIPDLLQYARNARITVTGYRKVVRPSLSIKSIGLPATQSWTEITGLRGKTKSPLAITRIYVRASVCPPRSVIELWPGALIELIGRDSGIRVDRIEQSIAATHLNQHDAARLRCLPGVPGLRIVRKYFDRTGHLFLASISLHPAARFSYAMTFEPASARALRAL